MSRFSAPINPERPRGAPSCNKCGHLSTIGGVACDLGRKLDPCDQFLDASVERTDRGGLKPGYFVARCA